MICPHCNMTVEDGASFCPHCHAFVGSEPSAADLFVFCEGCGARLVPGDRVCPKCGRPAPAILSTDTAASDLAAGRTASFPRLTREEIERQTAEREARIPRIEPVEAEPQNPFDPDATSSVQPEPKVETFEERTPELEDPYHSYKRPWAKIIGAAVGISLVIGIVYFVAADPLGMMPGFYSDFKQAASEMYPSRSAEVAETEEEDADKPAQKEEEQKKSQLVSNEEAYQVLMRCYNTIGTFQDEIGTAVDDYNTGYVYSDFDARTSYSESAYELRDKAQDVIDELDELLLPEGSPYKEDLEHVRQLAEWMWTRADVLCESWDISLSHKTDVSSYEDEVLAPLRDRSSEVTEAQDGFDMNYGSWEPVEKSASDNA